MAGVSLAETFHIALCDRRQSLARERAGFWSIDNVFERSGDEHLPDAGVACGDARHLVQDSETAVDLFSGGAVLLDGASEILPETGVEKVIVVPDLETGFGEEIREILLQILVDALQ